ncbi:hypothetical protein ASPZODRAFT_133493 [Penicilliopsis zonata CBS 506.65]|uniref:Aminotransferase class I/classII large domain-containing protein n=1 Tax=Penicilliopsis zonata CBS 506.65 TaxID=1073090 RepID=A0A1L9SEK3_9EURO|nr:hypothetical protein ASPZODRAFT_133493 [Penicilliopsis zonata CBS 506.65]OJJ45636.1 hypothetical protein ASPZODRAFT_133493 [Penicilliopsis zonata CBS 506.65]
MINLFTGWPNPQLLPVADLAAAASTVFSTPAISTPALLYGPDPGYEPLREHIATWLTSFYRPNDAISADRICITGGASQNLACLLQVFSDPAYTQGVWMVAPTYFLACRIMDDAGFAGRLHAVPEDAEGIDIAALRRGLQEAQTTDEPYKKSRPWRKIYRHIIYATPTFSNPSMKVMSLRRREELVRLAREHDALLITDDVYDFLQWPAASASASPLSTAALPRLVDIDRYLDGGPKDQYGHAVSNGSFSKLIGPGVRTGWAEGTPKLAFGLSQAGSSHSGGAPSHLTAAIVDQLVQGNLQEVIEKTLQPALAARYHIAMAAVKAHLLPLGVTLPSFADEQSTQAVAGGYFIWIKLPSPLRADELAAQALEKEEVRVAAGTLFRVGGDEKQEKVDAQNDFADCLRICFAWEEEQKIDEGIRRLGRLIAKLTATI